MRDFRQHLNGRSMRINEVLSKRAYLRHLCDTQPLRIVANGGESQHQYLQRPSQWLQQNQVLRGRRESNSRSRDMKESCVWPLA
jgi:hypothetical protein